MPSRRNTASAKRGAYLLTEGCKGANLFGSMCARVRKVASQRLIRELRACGG